MVKSKKMNSYFNKKAYALGNFGRIKEHAVVENADGVKDEFIVEFSDGKESVLVNEVVVLDKIKFSKTFNVITAVVVVNNRIYVGNATFTQNDKNYNTRLGQRLALSRALEDADGIAIVLSEIEESLQTEEEN